MSACSAPQKAEKLNTGNENAELFQEDTLAHEELFGKVETYYEQAAAKPNIRNKAPGNLDVAPKVGVQFHEEGGLFAVRFVAAIADASVTATWNRAVSDKDGNQLKPFDAGHVSSASYSSLKDGKKTMNATDEENDEGDKVYEKYVVYSMYNIPLAQAESYIAAYLTLSDGKDEIVSKVVAAQINGDHYFSFNISDVAETGCFLEGVQEYNPKEAVFVPATIPEYSSYPSFNFYEYDELDDELTNASVGFFRFSVADGEFVFCSGFFDVWNGVSSNTEPSDAVTNYTKITDVSEFPQYDCMFIVPNPDLSYSSPYLLWWA